MDNHASHFKAFFREWLNLKNIALLILIIVVSVVSTCTTYSRLNRQELYCCQLVIRPDTSKQVLGSGSINDDCEHCQMLHEPNIEHLDDLGDDEFE